MKEIPERERLREVLLGEDVNVFTLPRLPAGAQLVSAFELV
jgi:hypothetical protein